VFLLLFSLDPFLIFDFILVQGRASGTWDASSIQVSEKASAAGDVAELDGLRQKKQKGQYNVPAKIKHLS
jgi:hypothetical protein